jgi:UDPglucose 6-dehydrogenase
VDCWRVLPRAAFEGASEYMTLGFGVSTLALATAEGD